MEYSDTMKLVEALEGDDENRIIQALRTCIAEFENENDIDLEGYSIGSIGAIRLASALTKGNLPHIRKMQLNHTLIEEDGSIAIAKALPSCNISDLNLASNDIGNEGAIAIARAFPEASTLTRLEISDCQITTDGAIAIAGALPHCNISDLGLSGNSIGNEGAIAIARALPEASTLTRLKISDCQITTDGVIAIAKALPSCNISDLDLASNDIGNEGAIAIAKALKVNIQLENLVSSYENSTFQYIITVQTRINKAIKHIFKEYAETSKVLGPKNKDKMNLLLQNEYHSTINNIEELSKFINFMSEQLHLAKVSLELVKNPSELLKNIQKIKRRILFLKRNKTVKQLDRRVQYALSDYARQQQINNIEKAIDDILLRLNQLLHLQKKRTFSKMNKP